MNPVIQYDYIITGAGCAGLSLAVHLIQSGNADNRKILIIDKDAKVSNDRTWCFWEKEPGIFENIVYKKWDQLLIASPDGSTISCILPYTYKLIRGLDFYNYCLKIIQSHPNVHFIQAEVQDIASEQETYVIAGDIKYTAQYIFNSVLFQKPALKKNQYWLLQHFKGWFITAESPVFDSKVGTLMDFRTDQQQGTSFFYLLPFSSYRALVEYTVFSHRVLEDHQYETALLNYVERTIPGTEYKIEEKEYGLIPMTNAHFPKRHNNLIYIGTAGGQTKASSGYTFRFIQKHVANLVRSLNEYGHPFAIKQTFARFRFYDSVLLHLLHHRHLNGADIFGRLFKKNKTQQVLKFLDNETSLGEELRIISSLPALPFTKAAIRQLIS